MKVLLDVCTPVQVRHALPNDEVRTAVVGWGQLENGDLLREAEAAGFDLLIICDKNLRHQQNLTGRRLAILELWTNHRPTLEKQWPLIGKTATSIQPGQFGKRQLAETDRLLLLAPSCHRFMVTAPELGPVA